MMSKINKYVIKSGIFFLIIFLGAIFCNVNALNQNQLSVQSDWVDTPYYQGDLAELVLEVTSYSDNDLRIKDVMIAFEWNEIQNLFPIFIGEIRVQSGGQSVKFNKTSIQIPSDSHIGWNNFEVIIRGEERGFYGWSSFSWKTSDSLFIHSVMEKIYAELINDFNEDFEILQSITESKDSLSLITQAQNDAELSGAFALSGKWDQAVSLINSGINKLVDAYVEEEKYQIEKSRTGILISVQDQVGEPIKQVLVKTIYPSPFTIQGYSDNEGVILFESIEPGTYFFTIDDTHYTPSSASITVELGKISELYLQTQKISSLTITVEKSSGNHIEGAFIQSISTPNGTKQLSGYTDNSGKILFEELSVGNYTFEASIEGYQTDSKEIVVSESPATLEFELKRNWIPGFSIASLITGFCIVYYLFAHANQLGNSRAH
jgi:hypothetical protein